ncbi:Golgi-associated plant pathogenesis-related protein 1-like [Drosophila rhopaloa]|uniref:Golgi-associated plant pathogenesis-related protein 1-like n=1 Tax=Drosophila rhopaloa TaxID=1041015 RepID=A0A6P4E3X5_DRORH|nr:Golgi-associated plant pathogenesis-related protein 1-like [Drosophila rhopaloa]
MAAAVIIIVLPLFLLVAVKAGPKNDALREHNRLRRMHGSPPLQLDASLSKGAEQYARELMARGVLVHSSASAAGQFGENLCRHLDPVKCVQFWYDEMPSYNYNNPVFSIATGHFTSVVWKNTKRLGFGYAQDRKGVYYVVGRYSPKGNVNGRFAENVLRPMRRRRRSLLRGRKIFSKREC